MKVTADQIREWLLEGAPESPASRTAGCVARGPLGNRSHSRLYYAESAAFPSPMCAKVCLAPNSLDPDPGLAKRQYQALIRVGRAMGDDAEFSVPRPFLLRADVGLLAMQWIPGPSMTGSVFAWRCGQARAGQMMALAGRWLKRFHDGCKLAPGRLDTASKLQFVSKMEEGGGVPDPVFFRALAQLRVSAEAAAAVGVSRSWIHGDFKTDNLIVSGPRTVGIDFTLPHRDVVIYDLANFLNHLELALLEPQGWRLAASWATLRQKFVRSYLNGGEDAIALPLAWLQLFMLLERWRYVRAGVWWPRSGLIDFCFRRVASRLVERMGRPAG